MEDKEKKLTFKDLLEILDGEKAYCDRELGYIEKDPGSKYNKSKDFIKGYQMAVMSFYNRIKHYLPTEEVFPEIREATDEEKKEFTITSKFTASGMDVAINKIYGIDLVEGQEYDSTEVPYGIMEYRGEKIPVYADDPGQQDYCVYKGETISGGSYNLFPEGEFTHQIDYIKFYKEREGDEKDGNK